LCIAVCSLSCLAFAPGSAAAAITYQSSLEQFSLNNTFATGGASLSDSLVIAGFGVISGSVEMVGTGISLSGSATTGAGTQAGIDSRGQWSINDLIFTDINNPGATGTISVAANFLYGFTPATRMVITAGVHTNAFALNQQINGVGSGSASIGFINVPLNTLVTLTAIADLRVTDTTSGSAGNSATGFLQLADIPFFLPEGYTVSSADAGIANNSLTASIPEPAIVPLYLTGLAALLVALRRRPESV
jgi:hypothetical protein